MNTNRVEAAQRLVYRLRKSRDDWKDYLPSEYEGRQYIICPFAIAELGAEDAVSVAKNGNKGEYACGKIHDFAMTRNSDCLEIPCTEVIDSASEAMDTIAWGRNLPCVSGRLLRDVCDIIGNIYKAYACGKSGESLYLISDNGNRAIILGQDIPSENRKRNWEN